MLTMRSAERLGKVLQCEERVLGVRKSSEVLAGVVQGASWRRERLRWPH